MPISHQHTPNLPRSHRRLPMIIILLVSIGLIGIGHIVQPKPLKHLSAVLSAREPGLYQVTHVDDGDTIVVTQGGTNETVRLIGLDTPEVKDPRKPVQCFGAEASSKTKALLSGRQVRLEPDPIGDNRDKYHRLLRYVYLPDGTFVNQTLIKQGYAFAYVVFPFSKIDQFKIDEASAQAAHVGLWTKCQVDSSTIIKQTNPVSS